MITGFEEITKDLTYEEKVTMQQVIRGLKTKIGKENAITNTQMVRKLNDLGYKVDDRRMRKIINKIRLNRLVENLVANSKGYYVETDPKEIEKYQQSLIERAEAILAIAETYQKNQ